MLPIECKRPPTPKNKDRDEREYVINRKGTTGGVHRSKAGIHGAAYALASIIAYVPAELPAILHGRLNTRIKELDGPVHAVWTVKDLLRTDPTDTMPDLTI